MKFFHLPTKLIAGLSLLLLTTFASTVASQQSVTPTEKSSSQSAEKTSTSFLSNSNHASESSADESNTLVVTAEFLDTNVLKLPTSVTVIDGESIAKNNAQHFSELLNLAPNVNFATGASRGRFVQIRGIGERSEFSEPVNYSVGIIVDGIDMTGIATAATLLDTQQVEVLRGPQGTLYGANALAGLINVVTNSPTESMYAKLNVTLEDYNGAGFQAIASNAINDKFAYRVSTGIYKSDGFMDNVFLDRTDTNNIDESALKGQLSYMPSNDLSITTHLLFADIDNGYDAFSLDSNRTTYSDQPGHDRQKSNALSIIADWQISQDYQLKSSLSFADSELEYGYDEDWSHPGICDNTPCDSALFGFDWWYASFDNYLRDNANQSVDIQLHNKSLAQTNESNHWVIGLYSRAQSVDLLRQYTYLANDFTSQYDTQNTAIYGQHYFQLSAKVNLVSGLRLEKRKADYFDSDNNVFSPSEDLWGGKFSIEYQIDNQKMIYGLISRGYKAGGFNTDGSLPPNLREYATEYLWNFETGIKGQLQDGRLVFQGSLFFQDRQDVQTKQSFVVSQDDGRTLQEGGICPCSFNDYLDNAAEASSIGLELEARWQLNDDFILSSALGLLQAEFDDYQSFTHTLADQEANPPIAYDLSDRKLAHAPAYQLSIGADYYFNDQWLLNAQMIAKDEFYFSDRHQLQSDAYEQLNIRLSYQVNNWRIMAYIDNVTDEDIQTRGFGSFGNDPRKFYETEGYFQFAAPRKFGVTASMVFE